MADLLREQSSLSNGLSNISDEVSIRTKASRRARVFFNIERAKRELKEERERCLREFREEVRIYFFRVYFIHEILHQKHCGDPVLKRPQKSFNTVKGGKCEGKWCG